MPARRRFAARRCRRTLPGVKAYDTIEPGERATWAGEEVCL